MGCPRLALLGSIVLLAALGATGAPGGLAKPPTKPTKYYVVYKVTGSFSLQLLGYSCCGYNQVDTANWSYRERFGPVDLAAGGTHTARTRTPQVSGSFSDSEQYTPENASADCRVLGHFDNGFAQLRVMETHDPGFDGAVLFISADKGGLEQSPINTCTGMTTFFSTPPNVTPGCSGIRGVIQGSSQQHCSKTTFFTARVSVSDAGLRSHNSVYKVSGKQPAAEKVDRYCHSPPPWTPGYTASCTYNWSGTVTLQPAG